MRLAACLIEPLIQGAGGMIQPDPMFQRLLVHACRARGMPVIFDEVCSCLAPACSVCCMSGQTGAST